MIYQLSFRGQAGAVKPGMLSVFKPAATQLARDQALVGHEQVTFLIHGFNVDEPSGIQSLSKLAEELSASVSGAIVFVLWPGDSPIGPLSYSFTEGEQAKDTALELARFIETHVTRSIPVNFVAHSLGCRVALETIKRLYHMARGRKGIYPVKQVCLLAAAVDDYCLSIPANYKPAAERAERVVVLSSVSDNVLRLIYPLGDLIQAFVFFWKESFGLALGYHGPKAHGDLSVSFEEEEDEIVIQEVATNVAAVAIDKSLDVDHGDYLPSDKFNDKQKAAAAFTKGALTGADSLKYQI